MNDTRQWKDDEGNPIDPQSTITDTRLPLPWNATAFHPNATGCLKMYNSGVVDIKKDGDSTCGNDTTSPVCEYKTCYTTIGEQCIFPFTYKNGTHDPLTYMTCAGVDVHKPWCPTEVDPAPPHDIVRWGFCQDYCPTEKPEVACLEDPTFPDYVRPEGEGTFVNFTTDFKPNIGQIVLELDYVVFKCPLGYVFDNSYNNTQYALCHDWKWDIDFEPMAKCRRKEHPLRIEVNW
jgi:hypothetical protein